MRIALVSDTYAPQVNGVTTVLRRIVSVLQAARHDAVVVAPEYPGQRPDRADELRVPSVAFPPYPAIRLSLPAPRRVAHFLGRFNPEVVHVATEGPLGVMGRRWALRHGVPLMTSYHTNFPQYCRHYGFAPLEGAVWRWIARFHKPARVVHTPSQSVRAELRAHGLDQVVVWGNGVDTRAFHHQRRDPALRHALGLADDDVVVLHVGRLAPEKNLDVLTHAYRLAHDALGGRARFLVTGEGPKAAELRRALSFATHLPFLPREDLARLYAASELCVLPSRTETCGLVALEAMASGIPVIAANAGGFRESVIHGCTGLLCAPADPRAFASAIVELALDGAARHAMGAAARLAAVGRDSTIEDDELLDQYAAVAGRPHDDLWRAA